MNHKIIHQHEGEHIFLKTEEFAYLSKQLDIVSVPEYIIIDKNGKIVNYSAPKPFVKGALIDELRKYLNN
jgi:hypothetical protein